MTAGQVLTLYVGGAGASDAGGFNGGGGASGGGGLLLNPSGGNVGIGTSSPPRAPLDVNGSAFVANHSVNWLAPARRWTESAMAVQRRAGASPAPYLLFRKPLRDEYTSPNSCEDTDDNTTVIQVYNNSLDIFTNADFRVRWIIVRQQ